MRCGVAVDSAEDKPMEQTLATDPIVNRWREDTPACADLVHLNNAGASLMPRPVADAVAAHLALEQEIGGYEAADRMADAIADVYRHIAALIYLRLNPGGYEVMRRVLGHKKMDTTSNFYAGLEATAAARHFDAEILKLRNGSQS